MIIWVIPGYLSPESKLMYFDGVFAPKVMCQSQPTLDQIILRHPSYYAIL